MFTYKCRICGGTLELIEGSNIAVCEYCGTEQTVPKRLDENLQKLEGRIRLFYKRTVSFGLGSKIQNVM